MDWYVFNDPSSDITGVVQILREDLSLAVR